MPKINFCPLCLAHPDEHGEGREQDADILQWDVDITALYEKLQTLKSSESEATNARS